MTPTGKLGSVMFLAAAIALPDLVIGQLTTYPSRYYTIHSDLDEPVVREAALRITKNAEEYARRTTAFAGRITKRLPFYLFRHHDDYMAAGGLPKSSGVFTGDKLMAVVGEKAATPDWKVVQHEGFHQFVAAVIGGDIPVWVNEGLAEYFEEAVFTGDGLESGLIPQARLERVRRLINSGDARSIPTMMEITRKSWNDEMTRANYDRAWSMVHFLGHADGGAYEKRFNGFLRDVSRKGLTWQQAWARNFEPRTDGFDRAWRDYWMSLPDHPTRRIYARTVVATLTSFLGRAHAQMQTFRNGEEFFAVGRAGKLKMASNDWLPPSLLATTLAKAPSTGTWSLEDAGRRPPRLVCVLEDGTRMTGTFRIVNGRVEVVRVGEAKGRR